MRIFLALVFTIYFSQMGFADIKKAEHAEVFPLQKNQDPWERHPTLSVFCFANEQKDTFPVDPASLAQKLALAFSNSKKFKVWNHSNVLDQSVSKSITQYLSNPNVFPEEVKERVDTKFGIFGKLSLDNEEIQVEVRLVSMKTFSTLCTVKKNVRGEIASAALLQWEKMLPEIVRTMERAFVNILGVPAIPSGLYAIPLTHSILLRWDKNREEDVLAYVIFQAVKPGGSFQKIGKSRENEFEVTELLEYQEYYFKVKAEDSEGKESKASEEISCRMRRIPDLSLVFNVKSRVLPKKAQFSWNNLESKLIREYQIFRADQENGEFKMVGVSKKSQFKEEGLEDGKQYFYRVRKVYASGKKEKLSEFSNSFSIMTDARPKTITDFEVVSDLPQRVELNWKNVPEDKDIVNYLLFRRTFSEEKLHEIAKLSSSSRSYKDEKLSNNTTYYFKIKARDKAGLESDFSREVFARTKNIPDTPAQMTAKSNLPRKIRLSWAPDPLRKDLSYTLYRSETPGGAFKKITQVTQNFFVDSNLSDFKQYYYYVSANDEDNLVSASSEIVEARTKPLPATPQGIKTLNDQPRKATVLWDKNLEAEIDHYSVYLSNKFIGPFKKVANVKSPFFIDDKQRLKDATTYYYRVTAVDKDGLESLPSSVFSSTTKTLPSIPTGIIIKYQNKALMVSWQPVTGTDIFGYLVFKNGKKLDFVKTSFFLDTHVTPGMSYRYEICSMDKDQLISARSDKATYKIAKVDILKDRWKTAKEKTRK